MDKVWADASENSKTKMATIDIAVLHVLGLGQMAVSLPIYMFGLIIYIQYTYIFICYQNQKNIPLLVAVRVDL